MTLMVDDAIRNLVTAYPSASFDNHRYGQLFHSGLRASFESLRDVRRFINGLEFGFGMIASEVNGVDFIGVEALRVFYPKVFHAIRQNKALVAGHIDPIDSQAGSEQFKARVDATFRLADANIDDYKELVLELFPKLAYAYAKTSYGHNAETEWEKSHRVCTTRYFDFYFQLVVPEGEVSVAEIDKTVESARAQEELASNLRQYVETNRVRPAFESFRRRVDSIPRAQLPNVLGSLLEIGDHVKHLGSMMTGPLPEFLYVSWTIFDVLNLLAAHYRFAVFEQQCRVTDGVGTCFDVLANIEEINGKDNEKYKEFDKASLQALRELLVARVKQLASEGKLLDKDLLPSILVSWKRWGIEAEARAYVYGVISNPKDLIRFLNKFIFQTTSIGLTDKVARVENKLSMSGIAGIVDISAVVSQVAALDLSALSGQEKEIVELAREWLTKFRTSGLTPERFDARRGFDH